MRAWPPLLLLGLILLGGGAAAATGVCVFGPGGPAPAMHAAAAAFTELHPGVTVQVTAGPTPQWLHAARARVRGIPGRRAGACDFPALGLADGFAELSDEGLPRYVIRPCGAAGRRNGPPAIPRGAACARWGSRAQSPGDNLVIRGGAA